MWATCVFSWPIAKFLDYCSGTTVELGIFSNDELAGLIKHHERSEEHGGSLEQDTARVMLGALSLNGQKIGANYSPSPATRSHNCSDKESDVEKVDLVIVRSMIVSWSAVKTVDIDEPVDRAFIKKVKSWSYSRIPVVGEAQVEQAESGINSSRNSSWDAKKVFGFLHIKVRIVQGVVRLILVSCLS
jgi:metal transporter CNNM